MTPANDNQQHGPAERRATGGVDYPSRGAGYPAHTAHFSPAPADGGRASGNSLLTLASLNLPGAATESPVASGSFAREAA